MFDVRTGASGGAIPSLISDFTAAGSRFLTRIRKKGASSLRKLQLARMKSILMRMSDDQLTQIGITKSEISSYAHKLIVDEQDG